MTHGPDRDVCVWSEATAGRVDEWPQFVLAETYEADGARGSVEARLSSLSRNHRHAPCLGGVKVKGQWCSLADFAGGYTPAFAKAVVVGAEEYLRGPRARRPSGGFYQTPVLPEEKLLEEDQDFCHELPVKVLFGEYEDREIAVTTGGGEDSEDLKNDQHPVEESSDYSKLSRLSQEEKLERVQMLHRRLGHPSNEALVRMLQHGGANPEMIRLASELVCPACQLSSPPGRPRAARPEVRSVVFNTALHADLKYLRDFKGGLYVALSVVDEATNYHLAKLLRTRRPDQVASKFISMWIAMFGSPQSIRLDQGGEWEKEFIQMLEAHSIHSEFIGSHSPWSNGYAERHGALLGVSVQAIVQEKQVVGRAGMKLALSAACQAKNAVVSRGGHSAHYLVFGRQACYPELLDDDVWSRKSLGFALSTDGEVARSAEMRTAAKIALLRGDVIEKIKRALRRAPAGPRREYTPGEMVYFWSPARPHDGRYLRNQGAWRGPAIVLVPDGTDRYFVSWRGRCLLLSSANLKGATVEDANRHDLRLQDTDIDLSKGFVDMTDEAPPPAVGNGEPEAPFDAQAPGVRLRRRPNGLGRKTSEAKRMMAGLKSVKQVLKRPLEGFRRRRVLPGRHRKRTPEDCPELEVVSDPPPEVVRVPSEDEGRAPVDEGHQGQEMWEEAPPASAAPGAYDHLDDLPCQLRKRQRELALENERSLKKLKTTEFANLVMMAVSEGELRGEEVLPNEWLSRGEVLKLSDLLDLPLSSVRLHRAPRKRLQHPGQRRSRSRVTVMFGQDPYQVLIVEESGEQVSQRPRRRCPHLWRGASLFLRDPDEVRCRRGRDHDVKVYLQKGASIFAVDVSCDEVARAAAQDVEDAIMTAEAFVLKMKANGKELDPRHFSAEERRAFQESDEKEWKAWQHNHVVQELDEQSARAIPRQRIFKVPARVVRTNKALAGSKELSAKSRIVLPGHLDPDGGLVRTDAPTTQMSAVRMAIVLGLSKGWKFLLFDVATAFLSGREVDRDLYVKPPPDLRCAGAATLWRILKSAYGLSEAPRLWYMQARELLGKCGFEELQFAPATFVKVRRGEKGSTVLAILCLHVDDGFLTVAEGEEKTVRQAIDKLFSIKEWIIIAEKAVSYLGMQVYLKNGVFYNDMNNYIRELKSALIPDGGDTVKLGPGELKEYRRLVAQLRWPVHLVLPERLYEVSSLAQRVGTACLGDLRAANQTLREIQIEAQAGRALLKFEGLRGQPVLVSYFDAALGKSAPDSSAPPPAQRGEAHFIASQGVLEGRDRASLVEYHSNKISRVVRSSLAAEGSSMASTADRLTYNLKLLDALAYGKTEVDATWRSSLRSMGHLVTDARSLYDHVNGSGLATERQVSLDILAVRQMVQEGMLSLHWVPTWRQFADGLTKSMPDELFQRFRVSGCLNVVQTPEDEEEEIRRANLRRAQRERRKIRLRQVARP